MKYNPADHSVDRAIGTEFLEQLHPGFFEALQKSWSYQACYDGCKQDYPEDGRQNPSYGNCFVSSLVIWAANNFHGDILPCFAREPEVIYQGDPPWHFQLFVQLPDDQGTIAEKLIDTTFQQFRPGTMVEQLAQGNPDYAKMIYVSVYEPKENGRLRERLQILLNDLKTNGFELRDHLGAEISANDIVNRLEQRFDFARTKHLQNQRPAQHRAGQNLPGKMPEP